MADKRKNNTQDPTDFASALTRPKGQGMASRLSGAAAASGVETFTESDFEQVMTDYQFGAKVVTLEAAQGIRGLYVGPGTPVEARDPETGDMRPLATHEFELDDGTRIKLIESHQMKAELPSLVGKQCIVIRGGETKSKAGRKVTEYLIGPRKGVTAG